MLRTFFELNRYCYRKKNREQKFFRIFLQLNKELIENYSQFCLNEIDIFTKSRDRSELYFF